MSIFIRDDGEEPQSSVGCFPEFAVPGALVRLGKEWHILLRIWMSARVGRSYLKSPVSYSLAMERMIERGPEKKRPRGKKKGGIVKSELRRSSLCKSCGGLIRLGSKAQGMPHVPKGRPRQSIACKGGGVVHKIAGIFVSSGRQTQELFSPGNRSRGGGGGEMSCRTLIKRRELLLIFVATRLLVERERTHR